jgi:putative DNA-binding protein
MRHSDFVAALLDPAAAPPAGLVDPKGRPAAKRFDVYRNNVAASLSEVLEIGFPVLVKLLGAQTFKQLALIYLRAHPPKSRAISQYGAEMPAFLETFKPLEKLPYLADTARLELAIRASYHAADAEPLTAEGLDPEALMALAPRLAPATILLASPHPILSIWRFNTEPDAAKPQPGPEAVMISRPGFDPAPHLLPPGGLVLARALDGTTSLGAALEATLAAAPRADIAGLLTLLLSTAALTS